MRYLFIFTFLLVALQFSRATTFVPISMEKKLKEATVVLHGTFQGKITKKLPNDKIITEASFKILNVQGIRPSELHNRHSFKVNYPGGIWEDVEDIVHGAPNFQSNEEVVLFLSKDNMNNFWINSLAAGKYRVIKEGTKKSIVSEVFPNHPEIGKIDYDEFNGLVENEFGAKLSPLVSDNTIYVKSKKSKQNKNRKIASESPEEKEDSKSTMGWVIALFLIMAIVSAFKIRNR